MSQKKKKLERKIQKTEVVNYKESLIHLDKNLSIREILKKDWAILLGLASLIFILYTNSLWGDFVSDDYATILNNPQIANLSIGFKGFSSTYIANSLIANIFGVSPFQYHLFSTLLYASVSILAYLFIFKLFKDKLLAIITILFFLFHPIHVEAVSWISGKPYLFIAFFVLLSTISYMRYIETRKLGYIVISLISFILAFITDNPRPFSLFAILVLLFLIDKKRFFLDEIKRLWPYAIGVIILFLVFAWPHVIERVNAVNSGNNVSESIFYNPFFQYPTGLAKYFQIMFMPIDLTLYHTMYVFPVWLNWAVLITYLGSLIYFYFKDKRYFFALSFILVAILPSMAPVKVSWLVAERYAFLASLGFSLLLGLIVIDIGKKYKYLAVVLSAVLMSFYGIRTYLRNIDWQTNHKLWVNTCQVSPNSHNAWNNIGDDYDKLEQYDNSIKGFTQSTVVKPNYADAFHNRANIFYKIGRLDLARDSYNTALSYSPGLFQTYLSLTQIDLTEKRLDLAIEHASMAVNLQQNNPQSWYVLAVVQGQAGMIKEAKQSAKNALILAPDYKAAREILLELERLES